MTIDFVKLKASQLAKAAIVPQVLDNQWVPQQIIPEMIRNQKSLENVKYERTKFILKEWRRALIYNEQVIVNRAFMFNNSVVVDDYDDKKNQKYFKKLLENSVIVPYLYTEDAPDQKPGFDVDEKLWNKWIDTISDTKLSCIRLDWNDQSEEFNQLAKIFHNYIKTLDTPGQPENLASYLNIPSHQVSVFKEKLYEVSDFTTKVGRGLEPLAGNMNGFVTRNMLYKKFITAPNTKVDEGKYVDLPFTSELKQIIDLKYNVNLPDAFGRYALTPEDSLPRTALGDLTQVVRQPITNKSIQEILYALRRITFDKITRGHYLNSLRDLSLEDVYKIRSMSEWGLYTEGVHQLLTNPFDFLTQSQSFYRKFESLNFAITNYRNDLIKSKWEPWIKLTIAVGLKALEIWINPADPTQKLLLTLGSGVITNAVAPFLMRLTITASNQADSADLDVSLDFMRGTTDNGKDTWEEIINTFLATPGFERVNKELFTKLDSNLSIPENQN